MKKEEIQKRIYECETDEDIRKFILERITELESKEEKTVGQNYTDSFNEFISGKIHYKPVDLGSKECPDLVYDDMEPYISLIKSIRKDSWYFELTLFTKIFFVIYNYLPNEDLTGIGMQRFFTYLSHADSGKVSIKDIKSNKCAFCSENSGLSHNMFKILGIDSSVVIGRRDNIPHAYNIIYPNGYGNSPAVLYDPSHHIDFIDKEGHKCSFGYYKVISAEDYERLKTGENITLDLSTSGKILKQLYGDNGELDGYEMKPENPTYGIGLGRTELQKRNSKLCELESEAETIGKEESKQSEKQGEQK